MSSSISMFQSFKPEETTGFVTIPECNNRHIDHYTHIEEISSGEDEYSAWVTFEYDVEKDENWLTNEEYDIAVVNQDSIKIKKLKGCNFREDEMLKITKLPLDKYKKLIEDIAFWIEQNLSDELVEARLDPSNQYND